MYDARRWSDVVRAVPESDNADADLQMYRALSLARLERWDEARQALEAGAARHPRDSRFFVELGGIAYRQSNFSLATRDLRRALNIQPQDDYANNFVASIYFLDGNLEAALKYWNRAGQPKLSDLNFDPQPKLNPLVLDRTLQILSGKRVEPRPVSLLSSTPRTLSVYIPACFLTSKRDRMSTYDLTIHAPEKDGWGSAKLEGAVSLLRGLAYLTIFPEFYNLGQERVELALARSLGRSKTARFFGTRGAACKQSRDTLPDLS